MPPQNPRTALEVKTSISKILSSGEYEFGYDEASTLTRSLGEVFQELISLVQVWISQIHDVHPALFVASMILSSSVLFLVAWWGLSKGRFKRVQNDLGHGTFESNLAPQTPEELKEKARISAAASQYLESIRFLFRAYVRERELQVKSLSSTFGFVESQTYHELCSVLQKTGTFDDEMLKLLNILEQGLYGHEEVTRADYVLACRVLGEGEVGSR
jgi:hypothetical protein